MDVWHSAENLACKRQRPHGPQHAMEAPDVTLRSCSSLDEVPWIERWLICLPDTAVCSACQDLIIYILKWKTPQRAPKLHVKQRLSCLIALQGALIPAVCLQPTDRAANIGSLP